MDTAGGAGGGAGVRRVAVAERDRFYAGVLSFNGKEILVHATSKLMDAMLLLIFIKPTFFFGSCP